MGSRQKQVIMKKLASILAFLSLAVSLNAQYRTPSYADLQDSETVKALKEHVSYISSPTMEGRFAGSEGEKETAIYMTDVLSAYGIDIISGKEGDLFGLKQEAGDTLTSRNVIGFIPGYDKSLKDHYILIGARMDNLGTMKLTVNGESQNVVYAGANGNASGAAMLMELARMLCTNSLLLRRSVLIVGFGSSSQTFAGAWYFLNRSFPEVAKIDAMINLDALGAGSNGFYGFSCSNPDMNAVAEALSATLQPVELKLTSQQPFPSDHMAFYDKEIPSMMFTTGRFPEFQTSKDTYDNVEFDLMEKELEYIYNYSVSLINGPKPMFSVASELRKRTEGQNVVPYYDCDHKPSFLGSTDPRVFLQKWVYQYLKYPKQALSEGIQGKVLVDFIIDENGKVTDVKVLKGVDPALDDEAVRVISASPAWKPGYVQGKKVKSEISLYVEFRLEKKKKK